MPFPPELVDWFPDPIQRGRVRALGEATIKNYIACGEDDAETIPGTLAALAGLPAASQGPHNQARPGDENGGAVLQQWVDSVVAEYGNRHRTLTLEGCPFAIADPHDQIYRRQAYQDLHALWDSQDKGGKSRHVVVDGDAGLGKSVMSVFTIGHWLSRHPEGQVLWQYQPAHSPATPMFAILRRSSGSFTSTSPAVQAPFNMRRNDTLVIVDGTQPPLLAATTMLICSPAIQTSKAFRRHALPLHFTMQPWTTEELSSCLSALKLTSVDQLARANRMLKKWGPRPRMVINPLWEEDSEEDLDDALQHFTARHMKMIQLHRVPSEVSTTLFSRVVDSKFRAIGLHFSSGHIEKKVVETLAEDIFLDLEELLAAASDRKAIGSEIASRLVENVVFHRILRADSLQMFDYHQPGPGSCLQQQAPTRKRQVPLEDMTNEDCTLLQVPKKKNQPAFDAYQAPATFLQITTSNRHDLNADGLLRAAKALKLDELTVCFMVPEYRARTFKFVGFTKPAEFTQGDMDSLQINLKILFLDFQAPSRRLGRLSSPDRAESLSGQESEDEDAKIEAVEELNCEDSIASKETIQATAQQTSQKDVEMGGSSVKRQKTSESEWAAVTGVFNPRVQTSGGLQSDGQRPSSPGTLGVMDSRAGNSSDLEEMSREQCMTKMIKKVSKAKRTKRWSGVDRLDLLLACRLCNIDVSLTDKKPDLQSKVEECEGL